MLTEHSSALALPVACYMLQAPKSVSELCSNIDGILNIFALPSNYILNGDLQIIVFFSYLFFTQNTEFVIIRRYY